MFFGSHQIVLNLHRGRRSSAWPLRWYQGAGIDEASWSAAGCIWDLQLICLSRQCHFSDHQPFCNQSHQSRETRSVHSINSVYDFHHDWVHLRSE
jgi:hypothetical protein